MKPSTINPSIFSRINSWIRSTFTKDGLVNEFLFFSLSTGAYQISRLVVTLVAARWIGPDDFGIWNALYLILLYGVLINLGVPSGMNREVPILTGRGREDLAHIAANVTFWFVLVTGLLGALATVLILSNGLVATLSTASVVAMGVLFLAWHVYQYFQMRLRSTIQFRLMTIQQFVFAGLFPLIVLPMTNRFKLSGFIGGQALVAFLAILVIYRISSFQIEFQFDWSILRGLLKIGFPIMMAGLLFSLLTSVDRWVILRFLGVEALGQYTLAILGVGILALLPAVISQQLYPRMAFLYGSTGEKRSLLPIVLRQSLASTGITFPLIAATFLLMPFFVETFLPDYVVGIRAVRIVLVGLAFIPLGGGVANFLNTVDKQVYYLMVLAGAVLVNLGLGVLLVNRGWGLSGVAFSAAISYAFFTIALISVGVWVLRREHV
ncbi:MAG: oligosaccharide flippase family protein [Anaerolineales bacterium]